MAALASIGFLIVVIVAAAATYSDNERLDKPVIRPFKREDNES